MRVVEQHIIHKGDPRYNKLDEAAFASKNLWNAANYLVRQSFIFQDTYLNNVEIFHQIKSHEAYQALPRKVSNQVLIQLHEAWKSFFEALAAWKEHPEKFLGRPKLPRYKPKSEGRNLLVYEWKAVSKRALKRGMISLTGLGDLVKTKVTRETLYQVRIIPKGTHYVVEVVYERPAVQAEVSASLFASLDLGVTNLAAITSNKPGFAPLLVNGRVLKSINQGYNKQREHLQKQLARQDRLTSRRVKALTDKRNRRIQHHLHLPVYNPACKDEPKFSGRRKGRWYYASGKRVIHSDVNGSYNIARKAFSTAFDGREIEAPAVRPIRLAVK